MFVCLAILHKLCWVRCGCTPLPPKFKSSTRIWVPILLLMKETCIQLLLDWISFHSHLLPVSFFWALLPVRLRMVKICFLHSIICIKGCQSCSPYDENMTLVATASSFCNIKSKTRYFLVFVLYLTLLHILKQITSYTEIHSFRGSPYWMAPEVCCFLLMMFEELCRFFILRVKICHVVSYSKNDCVKYFKFFRS